MRLAPRSIQGRMLALSALVTLVALAIAGTLIAGILARVAPSARTICRRIGHRPTVNAAIAVRVIGRGRWTGLTAPAWPCMPAG